MKLFPIPEWHWDALCANRNPELYDTDSIPFSTTNPQHHVAARERCQGCPVLRMCALEAVNYRETSVVRAGVPLKDSADGNEVKGFYDMLRHTAIYGEFPALPAPDTDNRGKGLNSTVVSDLPPIGSTAHFLHDGAWYVGRVGAAQLLGFSPRTMDAYRNDGRFDVMPRFFRRNARAGQAGSYYPVDELLAAKERLTSVRAAV